MLDSLIEERLRKLERIKARGIEPYPAKIRVVGRARAIRDQGGVLFIDVSDESGLIQAVLKKDSLKDFSFWKDNLDMGDFIEISGTVFKTKRGEKSIEVKSVRILVKSLRPIPKDFYGLTDTESRLRKRYLDLLMNPDLREVFIKKSKFWDVVRTTLKKDGFLEVETPTLEAVPGGAEAEPFVTHHNALNTDFYLRISLEIALKKLLVGGYEKVFEIGRIFRNEGIDAEHLQDYTQMEFYWAYADYNDLMKLIERLYKAVVKETCGGLVTNWNGQKINWGKRWKKVDYVEIFKKINGLDPLVASREELLKKAKSLGLKPEPKDGMGRLIDLIYKKTIRPNLIEPCFLIDPPVVIEPLAKRSLKDPRRVERMQIVAAGTELGKGFSELNDPIDQRERFEEQMRLREEGDREAQMLDEDFLEALEYGMPPAAGFGMSERFFSVLMNKPVRETVFFPLMRNK
ncbi:MAG: lysine--tRNA ligase [Candidatus Colwellbacteria bacterium]|nr:lysine--tRNA ligase [Candidatus Colwellbacteria bacterium]